MSGFFSSKKSSNSLSKSLSKSLSRKTLRTTRSITYAMKNWLDLNKEQQDQIDKIYNRASDKYKKEFKDLLEAIDFLEKTKIDHIKKDNPVYTDIRRKLSILINGVHKIIQKLEDKFKECKLDCIQNIPYISSDQIKFLKRIIKTDIKKKLEKDIESGLKTALKEDLEKDIEKDIENNYEKYIKEDLKKMAGENPYAFVNTCKSLHVITRCFDFLALFSIFEIPLKKLYINYLNLNLVKIDDDLRHYIDTFIIKYNNFAELTGTVGKKGGSRTRRIKKRNTRIRKTYKK